MDHITKAALELQKELADTPDLPPEAHAAMEEIMRLISEALRLQESDLEADIIARMVARFEPGHEQ